MTQRIGVSRPGQKEQTDIEHSNDASLASSKERRITKRSSADARKAALVVIEQRALIRDCLVRCLNRVHPESEVIAFAGLTEWLETSLRHDPALILFSLMPESGPDAEMQQVMTLLAAHDCAAPVVIICDSEDTEHVASILKSGVRGYIPTSVKLDVALEAMRLVRAGGTFAPTDIFLDDCAAGVRQGSFDERRDVHFTSRQRAVLVALCRGKANKQIAYELDMCEGTVKVHVRHIMKKLRARNRTEAAIIANDLFAEPEDASR